MLMLGWKVSVQEQNILVQEGGCEVGEITGLGHVPALSLLGSTQISAEQLCQDVVLLSVYRWLLHG